MMNVRRLLGRVDGVGERVKKATAKRLQRIRKIDSCVSVLVGRC